MSHQAHDTQSLSLFKDYDSSETNHHGYKYPPNKTYINNRQHFPTCGNNKSIDYPQQPCKTIPSQQEIEGGRIDSQLRFPSTFLVYHPGAFRRIYNAHTSDGKYDIYSQKFTYYVQNTHSIIHFPKVPKDGDIFCSQRFDNELLLDIVSTESPRDHHSMSTFGSSMDRPLYRVHGGEGMASLLRFGEEILTFHEENRTATYYLPDKDIALHFTRIPKDGDIFRSQRNDNVLILEILSTETSQEHRIMHPSNMDLYQVHERNRGFVLMKMDNINMHSEEYYVFGGETDKEGNSTFTYYLPEKNMVCHFNRVPTHRDIFDSQRKNNIMILDVVPRVNKQDIRSYGSPWDADLYRVKQRDDGFELVMVTNSQIGLSAEDEIRRHLKIRRHIASNTSPDEAGNGCPICLGAYKDFDRIASMDCGHESHVCCIVPFLRHEGFCPICSGSLHHIE